MDLRDEVNYAVPQSLVKPKLSSSCPQSLECPPRTQDSCPRMAYLLKAIQNCFHPSYQLANESEAVGFSGFCFLTEKLSFLPVGLDMLVWGTWLFACTIKIHCACWDLRPSAVRTHPHQRVHGILPRQGGQVGGPGRDRNAQALPSAPQPLIGGWLARESLGCWLVDKLGGGECTAIAWKATV